MIISRFFLSILLTGLFSSPLFAGKWSDLVQEGQLDEAKKYASERLQYYSNRAQALSQNAEALEKITKLSGFSKTLISKGLHRFIKHKISKDWTKKLQSSTPMKAYSLPKLLERDASELSQDEWKFFINYVNNQQNYNFNRYFCSDKIEFSKQYLSEDNVIFNNFLNSIKADLKSEKVLSVAANIHKFVTRHLHSLIGANKAHELNFHGENTNIVVLDVEFNHENLGISYSCHEKTSLQGGEVGHGEGIVALLKNQFSSDKPPTGIIPKATLSAFERSHGNSKTWTVEDMEVMLTSYVLKSSTTAYIFNTSFSFPGRHNVLTRKEDGKLTLFEDSNSDMNFFLGDIEKKSPTWEFGDPIPEELIQKWQQEDLQELQKRYIPLLQKLFNNTNNLLIKSAGNEGIPLKQNTYGEGYQAPFTDQTILDHTLLVGGYDFIQKKVANYSNSAGDFKDHFILAPGLYTTYLRSDGTLYLEVGGATSYSASIVTGIAALLQSTFPNFGYKEIKESLLEGADRTIPGYDPKIHGKGMVNFEKAYKHALKIKQETQVLVSNNNNKAEI